MRDDRKLQLLFFAHAASGLLICGSAIGRFPIVFGLNELPLVPLYGLLLCQACLLGFWAAFSVAAWRQRLVGFLVAGVYLDILLFYGTGAGYQDYPPQTSLAAVTTAGILLVARGRIVQLHRFSGPFPKPHQERLIFSIRGLMVFTLIVALYAGAFRSAWVGLGRSSPLWVNFYFIWSLCVVVVCLVACWAALGRDPSSWRGLGVLVLSAALGALFNAGVYAPDRWETAFYIIAIMLLHAALSLGSLLVVRSCGYRLMSRSASDLGMMCESTIASGGRASESSSIDEERTLRGMTPRVP